MASSITYHSAFLIFAALYLAVSSLYVTLAIWCTANFRRHRANAAADAPAITVLKPIYGLDVNLYDNLRSFCLQDYPRYQIIFGVADAEDPAIPVIRRVLAEYPELDLELVINNRSLGSNRKISNVANAFEHAKYDLLVIADSDMRVGADYLSTVATCFADPKTGAATCLYRGTTTGGLPAALSAMFINEWFLPSVLVALRFQRLHFCFGATMALHRHVLDEIGGFPRLAHELADDYMLGYLVAARGYRVALVPYLVENMIDEPDLSSLYHHELRWARTVRSVQPAGYGLSFLTYVIPAALLFLLAAPNAVLGYSGLAVAVILRILMHDFSRASLDGNGPAHYALAIVRDLLCFAVWASSFWGRGVQWRGHEFTIDGHGHLELKESGTP